MQTDLDEICAAHTSFAPHLSICSRYDDLKLAIFHTNLTKKAPQMTGNFGIWPCQCATSKKNWTEMFRMGMDLDEICAAHTSFAAHPSSMPSYVVQKVAILRTNLTQTHSGFAECFGLAAKGSKPRTSSGTIRFRACPKTKCASQKTNNKITSAAPNIQGIRGQSPR